MMAQSTEHLEVFASWVVGRVRKDERPMVKVGHALHGEHRWGVWSVIAANHAGDYATATEGAVLLKRQAHHQAAGETIADMLNADKIRYDMEEE